MASTAALPGAEETIVLADHRTPLESREEVFAVADDSDSDEDRTAKPTDRPRWSGDEDDPRTALMRNADARQSWIDVGASSHVAEGHGQDPTPRSGLSAKAETILVRAQKCSDSRYPVLMSASAGHTQHVHCRTPVSRDWPRFNHFCHI